MGLLQKKGITSLGGNATSSGGLLQRAGITSLSQAQSTKPVITPTSSKKVTATKVTTNVKPVIKAATPPPKPNVVTKALSGAEKVIKDVVKGITFKLVPPSQNIDKKIVDTVSQLKPPTSQKITIKPGQKKIDPSQLKQAGIFPKEQTSAQLKQTPQIQKGRTATTKVIDNSSNAIKSFLAEIPKRFPETARGIKEIIDHPLSANASPKKALTDAWEAIKQPVIKEFKLSAKSQFDPPKSIAGKVGLEAERLATAGAIIFSPISALFSAANNVPVIGTVSRAVSLPFLAVGEGATKVSNKIIDQLPISKEAKDQLKPGIGEIFALAGQLALGKITEIGAKKKIELTKKFGEKDATTIVEKATELAAEKKAPTVKPTIDDVQAKLETYLTPGEKTPQEIIGSVIKSGQEKTAEGKATIQAAIEAQQSGQNIVIEKSVSEPIKVYRGESSTRKTPEGSYADAIPTSTNPDIAKIFSGRDGKVKEYTIDPKAKIADGLELQNKGIVAEADVIKYAKENGYDAVDLRFRKLSIQSIHDKNLRGFEDEIKVINKNALIPVEPKPKTVSVPRSQIPVGEGQLKSSGLEARLKEAERIQKHLDKTPEAIREQLGLSTYKEMNKKENIQRAVDFVTQNPEEAIRILKGDAEPPKGILRNSLFVAMQNKAIGDVNLARKLASIESTRLGQEISILTEIDPNSPVKIMRDLIKVREDAIKKNYGGKKASQVRETFVKKAMDQVKKPDKYDINKLIDFIETC